MNFYEKIKDIKRKIIALVSRKKPECDINSYSPKSKPAAPKVSVVVPVYNAEKYIERCLYYLLKQTLDDIELIFVNDGSTDKSMEAVKKLAEIDSRIVIIEQENKLQGCARNNGIKRARGEYIGFCDADDYVDLAYYEELYNAAAKYNSDIALAENVRVSKTKYKPRLNIVKEEVFSDIIEKFNVCKQNKNECPTNKIYKRKLLEDNEILFPEGVYCEDKLFSVKAVYYADKIVTVPNVHYYYWENPKSTVNSRKTKKHIQDRLTAKRAVLQFVKEKKIPVKNWYFKAEKRKICLFNLPLFVIKESTKSEKGYLLGVIPIYEKITEDINE